MCIKAPVCLKINQYWTFC